jgi:3-methylfumaryl-CoA hydratase
VGDAIRRDSEIVSVDAKRGRSGDLVFVTVRHVISGGNEIAVREEHDIVYRDAAAPDEPPPQGKPAPARAAWQRELTGDPILLFRYSALTFNGHRIHYDIDYVRHEEHYPGLIVHGPLQTTLLLDLCRRHAPRPVKALDYRALHPVFHTEHFTVNGSRVAVQARTMDCECGRKLCDDGHRQLRLRHLQRAHARCASLSEFSRTLLADFRHES